MKSPNRAVCLVCGLWALCLPAGASTITAVYDHFDDGVLDPSWNVALENAGGWTFAESGTLLSVSGITPTVVNFGNGGTFARVTLSRTFTELGDLDARCDIGWSSQGSVSAMQGVGIHLLDATGTIVSAAEYADGWVGLTGTRLWGFGATRQHQGSNKLPLAGSASLGISRVGSTIDVTWDGTTLATGTSSTPVSRVNLVFWYYPYAGSAGTSFFGGESIDLVRVEGTPIAVPEPSTILLLGSGIACFASRVARRRGRGNVIGNGSPAGVVDPPSTSGRTCPGDAESAIPS